MTGCFASSEAMTVSFNPSDPRRLDDLDCDEGAGVDVVGGDETGGEAGRPAEEPGST